MPHPLPSDTPAPTNGKISEKLREQHEQKIFALRLKLYRERIALYQRLADTGDTPPEFIPMEFLGT